MDLTLSFSVEFKPRDFFLGAVLNLAAAVFVLLYFPGYPALRYAPLAVILFEAVSLSWGVVQWKQEKMPGLIRNTVYGRLPVALLHSLAVTVIAFPALVFLIALFWSIIGMIFNLNLFRSRFLTWFLVGYLLAAFGLSLGAGGGPFLVFGYGCMTVITLYLFYHLQGSIRGYEKKITTQRERINYLAKYDSLTGVAKWDLFRKQLTLELDQNRRSGGTLALFLIDLDQFKHVNETLGHARGDRLLQEAALRIRQSLREGDMVSRLGGDKFMALIPGAGDPRSAAAVAQKILNGMTREFSAGGKGLTLTCSLGISLYPADGATAETLLKNCEVAMYMAKNNGRNRYQLFDTKLYGAVRERMELEQDLRAAWQNREFHLAFQPKVDREGRVVSMETLVRWNSPKRGNVPPGVFIPVAEGMGLISGLGFWVLEEACRQNRTWQEQGRRPLVVAVNLSMYQLREKNVLPEIRRILRETGLAPAFLELEITESALMEDMTVCKNILHEFAALGIKNSIDDFGTGYSSLIRLIELPLDALKIDKSFVDQVTLNTQADVITSLIVEMARHLDLETVAEGVENRQQFEFLHKLGCQQYQGYYFHKPLTAAQFEKTVF